MTEKALTFKDHFSVAAGYARYRPGYPDELFDFLAGPEARALLAEAGFAAP